MLSRRSILGLVAGAAAPAAAPMPQPRVRDAGPSVAPMALGARSVLDAIPDALHDAIRAGRGTIDLAPFINRAIAAADVGAGGGTLFFPAGIYDISALDLTRTRQSEAGLTLVGAGRDQTVLRAAGPSRVLLDASGRDNLSLLDLQLQSGAHVSSCGLLLARHARKPGCSRNTVRNVRIRGSFAAAGAVAIAAESNGWTNCLFENSHAASGHGCFTTTNDPAAIPLQGLASPIVTGPNTDNVMTDCEFYAPFDGARPVRFIGSAGYTMLGCSVIAGSAAGVRLATYVPLENIFSGPVTWQSPHLEVFGGDAVVHALAGAGTCYYRGVNSYSGNYQISEGALLLGQQPGVDGRPVVQNATWTVPLVSQGVRTTRIAVYALTDCSLAVRTGDGVGDVEVGGFTVNSHVAAAHLRIAQTVRGAAACL